MNFTEIARARQSCRSYDKERAVESEKLSAILESARLAPSACNGQPYHITVCKGEAAAEVAKAVQGMGMNKFASDAKILLVISEEPYVASAALGAKIKKTTIAPSTSAFFRRISRRRPPRRDFLPAFSAGWTMRRSAGSAVLTAPCAL